MIDDEFELPESDLNDDEELSEIDEQKLKLVNQIIEYAEMVKDNIQFKEKSEYVINFRVLARYVSQMTELDMLDNEELPEEELLEKLKEIEMSVKELSVSDLRTVEEDYEEGKKLSLDDIDKKDDDNDGSTDW